MRVQERLDCALCPEWFCPAPRRDVPQVRGSAVNQKASLLCLDAITAAPEEDPEIDPGT